MPAITLGTGRVARASRERLLLRCLLLPRGEMR